MSSIYKHRDGYRAQVRKRGVRTSGVFRTRAEASRWAAGIERDLEDRRLGLPAKKTWRDAVERYRLAVSSKKRTATSEDKRLTRLLQVPFADMALVEIKADDWVQWRDGLGKRLSALDLCMVLGWRDPKMALRYYHPSADDLAAALWPEPPA